MNQDILMSALREQLEALRPGNGNRFRSQIGETNSPTGAELANLFCWRCYKNKGSNYDSRADTGADGATGEKGRGG